MTMSTTSVKMIDGCCAGQLQRHAKYKIDDDLLWTTRSLEIDTDAVYETHMDFVRAGADIIETNSYLASLSDGMMKQLDMCEGKCRILIIRSARLAKAAVRDYAEIKGIDEEQRSLVAACCGPYGACQYDGSERTGAYGKSMTRRELMDWHRPRIEAFMVEGVDLLALETIPCVEEAEALLELLRVEFPDTRAWLSFSCKDGKFIADGSVFQEVAVRCYRSLPSQLIAVGVNCIDSKYVTPLLKGINTSATTEQDFIPLIAYPNRSGSFSATGEWNMVTEWLDLGVRYIGGCCKVFAEDIKEIRSKVDQYRGQAT